MEFLLHRLLLLLHLICLVTETYILMKCVIWTFHMPFNRMGYIF
jgi:hypothetical protein